ncbi:unnamed protein product [Aphanomyces euteiches]
MLTEGTGVIVLTILIAVAIGLFFLTPSKQTKREVPGDETSNNGPHDKKLVRDTSASDTIVNQLKQRAADTPNKVVYIFLDDQGRESVTLTFADLDRAARKVAATLQTEAGVKKGDRVMLCYPPGLDFAMGFWGCLYAGAIGIPTYPPYPGTLAKDLPKFNRMVADSGANVILTNRTYHLATQLATAKSYFSRDAPTWPKDIQWFSTDAISSSVASKYD